MYNMHLYYQKNKIGLHEEKAFQEFQCCCLIWTFEQHHSWHGPLVYYIAEASCLNKGTKYKKTQRIIYLPFAEEKLGKYCIVTGVVTDNQLVLCSCFYVASNNDSIINVLYSETKNKSVLLMVRLFLKIKVAFISKVQQNMGNLIWNDWHFYCRSYITERNTAKRILLNGNVADGF